MVRGFATELLKRGEPLGVAVSGGADSVALLHLLADAGFRPVVLHVNHGLRGAESEADQEFVSQKALALGFSFLAFRAPQAIGNVEQSARRIRYQWFRRLMRIGTLAQVATAHTADDQAETVLSRFLRGSGSAGLSGVRPEIAGIVRPLLTARRSALRNFLSTLGIAWREDSSNLSLDFQRNRIRHRLLPHLQAEWNSNLTGTLAQTASWAQAEEEYWRGQLPLLTANWVRFANNSATLETEPLRRLPLAAARRVVRQAIEHAKGDLRQVAFVHVECILALASRTSGNGSFRTARWQAQRSGSYLRIATLAPSPAAYCVSLAVPGLYPLPGQHVTLRLELKSVDNVYNDDGQQVDWALISGSLQLRNWQPGDRFQPAGEQSTRKLKHFFQKAGIPSWERSGWPVITCANSILWTRGQGVAPRFCPSAATVQILSIEEVPNESTNQNVSN